MTPEARVIPSQALGAGRAALAALLLAVSLALFLQPGHARAWDGEADRLVAQLAYERLDPAAKTKVDALLNGFTVPDTPCRASSMADAPDVVACLKRRPQDFMHNVIYDPLPICGPPLDPPPCGGGHCASTALKLAIETLKSPTASTQVKGLAVLQTAYLMSELHQPLHTADNDDHSGDRVRVLLPGSKRAVSLYGVWDTDMVADAIGSAEDGLPYARALATTHAAAWAQGGVDDWVADTHQLAVSVVYGRLPDPPACRRLAAKPEVLTRDYFAVGSTRVREQLAKAAVRLATVLNAALD